MHIVQELRKTGLENLLVEESMKNLRGNEVKLAKLPKHILKEPRDAETTSAKMIQQLKDVSSKLGSEVCVNCLPSQQHFKFRGLENNPKHEIARLTCG